MNFFNALLMGLVEGLTEFLPVSSTGHLIMVADMLHLHGNKIKTFEIIVQLGAILAVAMIYRKKYAQMLRTWCHLSSKSLNWIHLVLAMIPAVTFGLIFHAAIKTYLFGIKTVLVGLIFGALLLLTADRKNRKVKAKNVDDLTYSQAFGIGMFQCFSLWPGFSRSGSTISGGMILGTSQKAAADFTFLVSVPIMMAASVLDFWKNRALFLREDLGYFVIGLLAAFIVSLFAVLTFLKVIKTIRLYWFALYRLAIAGLFFIYWIK